MSRWPLELLHRRRWRALNRSRLLNRARLESLLAQVSWQNLFPGSSVSHTEMPGVADPSKARMSAAPSPSSVTLDRRNLFTMSEFPGVRLTPATRNLARGLDPRIRRSNFQLDVHRRNTETVIRLDPLSWPRSQGDRRLLWPSSPSLNEWMEMTRRGVSPCSIGRHAGKTVRVSRREQMQSITLTKRICMRHIIGIRSDVEVPRQYLGYFRYRWGFLILTAPYNLPSGLARWLVSRWCKDPHSLWLEWFGTLKQYLREVPIALIRGLESEMSNDLVLDEIDDD